VDLETFINLFVAYQLSGSSNAKDNAFKYQAKAALINSAFAHLLQYQKINTEFLRDANPEMDVDFSTYGPSDLL
jgi:hypothetical protein